MSPCYLSFFIAKLFPQLCLCNGNGLMSDVATFEAIMNEIWSHFSVMNDMVNDKAHNFML